MFYIIYVSVSAVPLPTYYHFHMTPNDTEQSFSLNNIVAHVRDFLSL